jgi:hypothetical protein
VSVRAQARLDARLVRGIVAAVDAAGGSIEDVEDLVWVWLRVVRDSADRAARIRADVIRVSHLPVIARRLSR